MNSRLTAQYERAMRPFRKPRTTANNVRERVCYICEYFFGGDVSAFAAVLGVAKVSWLRLRLLDCSKNAMPISFLARIVQQTDVRAEWLLTGTGPVLRPGLSSSLADDSPKTLVLPAKLRSTQKLFAGRLLLPDSRVVYHRQPTDCTPTPAAEDLANFLLTTCGANRPILLFVGFPAVQAARKLLIRLIAQNCVSDLIFTGAAVDNEVPTRPTTNMNTILRFGAMSGIGLGEAVQRWGATSRRSPIRLARNRGISFAVHVIFGEMAAHYEVPAYGAEVGAALGACAYVDLLAITEHIRRVLVRNGVFLVVGDARRAVDLFLSVLARLAHDGSSFTVVVLGSRLPDESCQFIHKAGGTVRFLEGDLPQVAEEFRLACVRVFDGKLHDDKENTTDD